MNRILLTILLAATAAPANAAIISATTPIDRGVTITTSVDTDLRRIRYTLNGLSVTNIGDHYEQIGFDQPELPISYIDGPYNSLVWNGHHYINVNGSMYTPYASGWVWDLFDNIRLQIEYQQGDPPGPEAVFGYDYKPEYQFTGTFLDPGATGDSNITISRRNLDEIIFSALIPELEPTPVPGPAGALLMLSGLLAMAGALRAGGRNEQ